MPTMEVKVHAMGVLSFFRLRRMLKRSEFSANFHQLSAPFRPTFANERSVTTNFRRKFTRFECAVNEKSLF